MESLANLLPNLDKAQKSRITSERQDIIRQFVEAINRERLGTKYKQVSGRTVAVMVGHLKDNHTLYYFLSQCKDGKNRRGSFSKVFYGALKVR